MAFRSSNAPLVLSISLAALLVSGCGGGEDPGLISRDDAPRLLELLDQAEKRFDDGSCDELETTLTELDREADQIPDAEVDARLRTTLNGEIQELTEMAAKCEPAEEEIVPEPVPAPAPVVPETTAPAPVEPTTTEETEPTTEEEEQAPPEEKPPQGKPPEPPQSPPEKPPKPPGGDPCENGSPRC
jgi:hypothetical protein